MSGSLDDYTGAIFGGDFDPSQYDFLGLPDGAGDGTGSGAGAGTLPLPPTPPAGGDPNPPGWLAQANTWLNNLASSGGNDAGGGSASVSGPPGGSGQTGAFAQQLKTALAGLQNVAKGPTQAKAGTPGSAWPWGQPKAALPSQSRGSASPGLDQMIQLLRARQQQYMQMGGQLPSSAPGGGLLGM